ncbi:MacS family sensor histidine kinase [Micromonospora sp. CPCC 206061]|uniref:MacS family sensor histidine kinase n=1 Tax=Micromonospora sp. CPCC 206061 TaxID=3122410 RepID=UPI002FEF7348
MPDALQVPLWRAIAVFRFASMAFVLVSIIRNVRDYTHPVAAVPAVAILVLWSAAAAYLYARPAWRRWPLLLADLLVALALLLATPWVVGRAALDAGAPTLAVAWQAGPVLTWAVSGGRRRGAVAALILGAADLIVRDKLTQSSITGLMLMLLAGVAVGHVARLTVESEQRLQRAAELEAAGRERERLARGIHDSVLQVLAMVQRRGAHLDGEAGELARLAGEQEAALRALIATSIPPAPGPAAPGPPAHLPDHGPTKSVRGAREGGAFWARRPAKRAPTSSALAGPDVDLRTVLDRYASPEVSIAAPATPVLLPDRVATEIGAAVGAALDNVVRHCAGGARAWVLLEDEPSGVVVSVRDDGPGIAEGRLAEAAGQGRLGVAQSIRGRIADLGGTVEIVSAPGQGTEVELRVPRVAA